MSDYDLRKTDIDRMKEEITRLAPFAAQALNDAIKEQKKMDNKARADAFRAEVNRLMPDSPIRVYLQRRADELDPPLPVLPQDPKPGDVIDAEFHQMPHAGTFKVRLYFIGDQWMNKNGDSELAFDHIVNYKTAITGGFHA